LYCAQVCFVAEQRKKKKQEKENEKRVENKERERKGGEFFSSAMSCLASTGGLCPTVTGTH
jgi:hypothetical protein